MDLYIVSMVINERHRAVHELGHALVALSFGWAVLEVGIDVGDSGFGGVRVSYPDEDALLTAQVTGDEMTTVREIFEQRLIHLAAGAAAEEVIYGGLGDAGSLDNPKADWAKFWALVSRWEVCAPRYGNLRFGPHQPFQAAKQAAKAILEAELYQPLLDALADQLIQDRVLNGDQFYAAVLEQWISPVSSDAGTL